GSEERFERLAGRVRGELVIAGDDPNLAAMFESDLSRPEDVPGRMQRDADAVVVERLSVGQRRDVGVRAEAGAEDRLTGRGGQILTATAAGVVGVGVREDRAVDGPPGIDVEGAGGAGGASVRRG